MLRGGHELGEYVRARAVLWRREGGLHAHGGWGEQAFKNARGVAPDRLPPPLHSTSRMVHNLALRTCMHGRVARQLGGHMAHDMKAFKFTGSAALE